MTEKTQEIKKIVLVGGCFDVLHFGHIVFLKTARSLGEFLIVALESDKNVRKMKGDRRPIHTQEQRRVMLESVQYVDKVILLPSLETDREYTAFVNRIKPNIIAVTEGDPILKKKQVQAENIGAGIVVIPKVHTPSTSQLAKLLGLE